MTFPPPGPQTRLRAPSAAIVGAAGSVLTVADHVYTAPADPVDAAHFLVGDVVEARSDDLGTLRGTATVVAVAGSVITLSAWPGMVLPGDVLLLAPRSAQPVSLRALRSFFAEDSAAPSTPGADRTQRPA